MKKQPLLLLDMWPPTCQCHGMVVMVNTHGTLKCVEKQREADLRYKQSEKGREANRRYKQSEKGREKQREADLRYKQSEKGMETRVNCNAKRVFVGQYYVGMTRTTEGAAVLNQIARDHFTNQKGDMQ